MGCQNYIKFCRKQDTKSAQGSSRFFQTLDIKNSKDSLKLFLNQTSGISAILLFPLEKKMQDPQESLNFFQKPNVREPQRSSQISSKSRTRSLKFFYFIRKQDTRSTRFYQIFSKTRRQNPQDFLKLVLKTKRTPYIPRFIQIFQKEGATDSKIPSKSFKKKNTKWAVKIILNFFENKTPRDSKILPNSVKNETSETTKIVSN